MFAKKKKTVAIMQPYFFPYAGYYRLLLNSDVFVIYDCVQFPRSGWVHRNLFTKKNNEVDWLTLPIRKCSQKTSIMDLEFDKSTKYEAFLHSSTKYKIFTEPKSSEINFLFDFNQTVVDLLEAQIRYSCERLGFKTEIIRSSELSISGNLKGESRILEIAKSMEAKRYINLSGGVNLYDYDTFSRNGIELSILQPFVGDTSNMLERLNFQETAKIKTEIDRTTSFFPPRAG